MIQAPLDAGADPNIDRGRRSPLLILATSIRSRALVEMLLNAGADPEVQDRKGRSALEVAEEAGDAEVVRLLEAALDG